jgi:DNA-binding transcriptional regulator YiaG
MNQTEFGALFGVKRTAVANWEADRFSPNEILLEQVSNFISISQ